MPSNDKAFGSYDSRGSKLNEGVYFYILKSEMINAQGFVHIVRDQNPKLRWLDQRKIKKHKNYFIPLRYRETHLESNQGRF
jgi:hypothetical protein